LAAVSGRVAVVALALVAAVLFSDAMVVAVPSAVLDLQTAAAAADSADRLGRRTLDVMPTYPTGRCDEVVGGLALRSDEMPNAVSAIGASLENRTIWAEHWGPIDGPQVLLIGQVHGNECSPLVFASIVREAETSSVGYWIIPTLNPDGYARFSRYNAAGVDLNADGYWMSQPETVALMQFTRLVQPAVTIHVHSPNSFVGWYGGESAMEMAIAAATAAGLRLSLAGARSGPRWFLWQGQHDVWPAAGSVLIELDPVVAWEAPTPFERGPVTDLATTRARLRSVLLAIERVVVTYAP
jgi:murein peptide amidase A